MFFSEIGASSNYAATRLKFGDLASVENGGSGVGSYSADSKKEGHRFYLALVIIFIFGAVLVVAMIGKYADPPTLAGIFSGWIVAIIAFYFMDEASDRAVQQETRRKLGMQSQDSEELIDLGLKEKDKIIQDLSNEVTRLAKGIKDYEQVVSFLESKLEGGKTKEPDG